MKWKRGQESGYVRDQRGTPSRGMAIGGGGLAAVVIGLLVTLLGGGGGGGGSVPNLNDILGQLNAGGAPSGGADVTGGTGGAADDELEDFMRAVMNDLNAFWDGEFERSNLDYTPTELVLFEGSVSTGCGQATEAVGPFYCPPDQLAYIDLGFYDELRSRFGAPGDFAQAYVIAHEVGHHVQNLLGATGGGRQSNEESVRIELQADCYAGVWASTLFGPDGDIQLEDGDIEEGLGAAAAVGDDRIQASAGQDVNPETWTHGSAALRTEWFRVGLDSGDADRCDTSGVSV